MNMVAPSTDVTRGPHLSSTMPTGSFDSAFPAMPQVATVVISDTLRTSTHVSLRHVVRPRRVGDVA